MQPKLPMVLPVVLILCTNLDAKDQLEPRYNNKPLSYWVERFEKAETDNDREEAVNAICKFGKDAAPAAHKLILLLDDHSDDFRLRVERMLSVIGSGLKPVVPELVKMLQDGTARYPKDVIEVIGYAGTDALEAVPILTKMLDNPNCMLMRSACFVRSGLGQSPQSLGSKKPFSPVPSGMTR